MQGQGMDGAVLRIVDERRKGRNQVEILSSRIESHPLKLKGIAVMQGQAVNR